MTTKEIIDAKKEYYVDDAAIESNTSKIAAVEAGGGEEGSSAIGSSTTCSNKRRKIAETQQENQQQQQEQQQQNNNNTSGHAVINTKQKKTARRRSVCARCSRPKPQTCICASLPDSLIYLDKVEIVILQHPLEIKNHKSTANRSVPLLELCLHPSSLHLLHGRRFGTESLGEELYTKLHHRGTTHDEFQEYIPVLVFPKLNMEQCSNRNSNSNVQRHHHRHQQQYRQGRGERDDNIDKKKDQKENDDEDNSRKNTNSDSNETRYYREEDAIVYSLKELLHKLKQDGDKEEKSKNEMNEPTIVFSKQKMKKRKILLLVLDATWKHAREMHKANIRLHQYPLHMLRLHLTKEDFTTNHAPPNNGHVTNKFRPGRFQLRGKASTKGYNIKKGNSSNTNNSNNKNNKRKKGNQRKEKDADDEEPLDGTWMSTAECIAWIVSEIEENEDRIHQDQQQQRYATNSDNTNEVLDYPEQCNQNQQYEVINNNYQQQQQHQEQQQKVQQQQSSSLSLYEILMKPLDAMVMKWKSFVKYDSNNTDNSNSNNLDNDNCSSTSTTSTSAQEGVKRKQT